MRIGARNGESLLKGLVDDVRFYKRALSAEDARLLTFNGFLPTIAKSRGNRSDEERADLQRFYKENYAVDYLRSETALAEARKHKEEFYKKIPTTLVMEEMTPPRDTFVLVRGDFRNPGEKVTPGTPSVLPPLPEGDANRLTLARWLVAKENPLTARVTVNRYWSLFFGEGLVKTINDFGSQGEWPSHPELLDWLAVQFRDGGDIRQRGGERTFSVRLHRRRLGRERFGAFNCDERHVPAIRRRHAGKTGARPLRSSFHPRPARAAGCRVCPRQCAGGGRAAERQRSAAPA